MSEREKVEASQKTVKDRILFGGLTLHPETNKQALIFTINGKIKIVHVFDLITSYRKLDGLVAELQEIIDYLPKTILMKCPFVEILTS